MCRAEKFGAVSSEERRRAIRPAIFLDRPRHFSPNNRQIWSGFGRVIPAFLPGSTQNIESEVTYSKQSRGKFLPGARTHFKIFRFWPFTTQNLAKLIQRLLIYLEEKHSEYSASVNSLLSRCLTRASLRFYIRSVSENHHRERISNRFWLENRSYRKQTTRPRLTGSRIRIKVFEFLPFSAQKFLRLPLRFRGYQPHRKSPFMWLHFAALLDGRGVGQVKMHDDRRAIFILRRYFDGVSMEHFLERALGKGGGSFVVGGRPLLFVFFGVQDGVVEFLFGCKMPEHNGFAHTRCGRSHD